jgi:mannose-6-phosphate isomerase-like protein (cupin superfamily)
VEFIGADRLKRDAGALAAAGTLSRPIGDRQNFTYLLVQRSKTGEVEIHADWNDVLMVESGEATVLFGGRSTGAHETAPGEQRGGAIAGGRRQHLGPGDLLIIPPGVPHQVELAAGRSVAYIAVKVRRADGSAVK